MCSIPNQHSSYDYLFALWKSNLKKLISTISSTTTAPIFVYCSNAKAILSINGDASNILFCSIEYVPNDGKFE